EDGLDEHRGADGADWKTDLLLLANEDVVPQPRLEVRLHLRQIEVRSSAARNELFRVVEEIEREVEEARGDRLRVDEQVLFEQMPSARADHERRRLLIQRVMFLAAVEGDRAAHGIAEVDVTVEVVGPRRRVRVFEVGHEDVRAGVERVDHHLEVDGPGDLDAAVEQVAGNLRHGPVRLADAARLFEEARPFAGVEALLALLALAQQFLAARIELALQHGHELQRLGCEDALPLRAARAANVDITHCGDARHRVNMMSRLYAKVNKPKLNSKLACRAL